MKNMEIEKKLAEMSKDYEENPDVFIRGKENIDFAKRTEEKIKQLELIRNSISLEKSNSDDDNITSGKYEVFTVGKGMDDISKETEKDFLENNSQVESIIYHNKKMLSGAYGIENTEQFLSSKELSKDKDIGDYVNDLVGKYKKSEENRGKKWEADNALKTKLISLGMIIDSVDDYNVLKEKIDKELEFLKSQIQNQKTNNKEIDSPSAQNKENSEKQREMINNFLSEIEDIEKSLPVDEEITFYGNVDGYEPQILKVPSIYNSMSVLSRGISELDKKKTATLLFHRKNMRGLKDSSFSSSEEKVSVLENEEKKYKEGEEEIGSKILNLGDQLKELEEKGEILAKKIKERPELERIIKNMRLETVKGKPSEIFSKLKDELEKAKEKLDK